MYLLVFFLPLFSSISSFFFTRFLGKKGSIFISCFFMFLCFLCSWFIFFDTGFHQTVTVLYTIDHFALNLHLGSIPFILIYDSLTCVMLIVVVTVSFLVHLYGYKYMEEDPRLNIFFCYISLFTFFMLVLICTGSFFHMFFGWEGVGLCSYLLINFWYTRIQANKAAIKAMLINRIGDMFLTLGLLLVFYLFGSLNYGVVFSLAPYFSESVFTIFNYEISCFTLIGLFFFLGAVGKSAQIGLHTWLPDAMEGPTPVSALIHAATMVTAGVFLLARSSPILEFSSFSLGLIIFMGAVTSFVAATTGLFQNDIKKVIAYSTCSQLGYMVFACGLSGYNVGIFHLANHAFFKALLFLTAGSIIHSLSDEQDMRRMGGLLQLLPFSYAMIFIGSIALAGFPFLSGFYSKDVILELSSVKYTISGVFSNWLGILSAFFTAFYSTRLLVLTFLNKTNAYIQVIRNIHESSFLMMIPLIILCFGSIFFGFFFKDLIIGLGTDFWGNSIFIHPKNLNFIDAEFLPFYIKLIPFFFTLLGIFLGFFLFSDIFFSSSIFFLKTSRLGRFLYFFFNKKWLFDLYYNSVINQNFFIKSFSSLYLNLDKGLIELFGPQGFSIIFYNNLKKIFYLQTGLIFHYTFTLILFLIFIIFFSFSFFYSYIYLYIFLFFFILF